jgi:hypothetical protein
MMSNLSAALAYARRGLRVLPCRERAKEPLLEHGVHDSSTDVKRIQDWYTRWPGANVAIAVPSIWCIVDVDQRSGGFLNLSRFVAQHGALPETLTAETGSGGAHYVFGMPAGVKLGGKLCPGVDLLCAGRYFLAAPSTHPNGGRYRWTSARGVVPAPLPQWIVDVARVREEPAWMPPPAPVTPDAGLHDRARVYVAVCEPAISGQGGHRVTFILAQKLVRGFLQSDGEALALMLEWNEGCQPRWTRRELVRKITQARTKGTLEPGKMAHAERRRR